MRYKNVHMRGFIVVLVAVALFCGCREGNITAERGNQPGINTGDQRARDSGGGRFMLPDFSLQDLEGREHRLFDYIGKKPILLVFWTSNCRYCLAEIPDLNRIFQERSDTLNVLSINVLESQRAAQRMAVSRGIRYPVLLDRQGLAAQSYHIRGVPTHIVIDLAGSMGYYGHDLAEAIKRIDQLKG